MKVSGTKKFLIILFSLVLAVTAGLGVFFISHTPVSAYADEEEPEIVYDDEVLQTIADETGVNYEAVNFYAHAFNLGSEFLYEEVQLDRDGVVEDINLVLADYASGNLNYDGVESFADEDWFIAPDLAHSFTRAIGLQDTWTEYVAPANKPISAESDLYWGNTNFTVGNFYRQPNEAQDYDGVLGNVNTGTFFGNGAWDMGNFFMYSWAWLNEGEEYEFGIKSSRPSSFGQGQMYSNVYIGAQKAEVFFEESLTFDMDPVEIGQYTGKEIHPKNIQGYWFSKDSSGTYRGKDPQQRTLAQYKQDYATNVDPTTPMTTDTDTKFMKWTRRSTAINDYNRITISADAPSGVYYFRTYIPFNDSTYRYVTDNASAIEECNSGSIRETQYWWQHQHNGWSINSSYCDYAVIVQRSSITKPSVQIETGVNNAHTEKTVTYNSEAQSITINNDWGEGLMMCTVTYKDSTGTVYTLLDYALSSFDPLANALVPSRVVSDVPGVPSGSTGTIYSSATNQNVTIPKYITYTYNIPGKEPISVTRGARGRLKGEHENLVLSATDKGTYTVKLTPFNKWADGTSSVQTFTFKIVDRYLTRPAISADGNGTIVGNTKTVHDDGNVQFVNYYPVPAEYLDWEAYYEDGNGGFEPASTKGDKLLEGNWSDDGMLTLEADQGVQGKFKIVIFIKTPDNVKWTDGGTDNIEFYFSIEPRLLTVSPTILGTSGVDNINFTKTLSYSGSYQTMNIMYVDGTTVTYDDELQISYISDGNPDFNPKGASLSKSQSLLALTAFDAGTYIVTLNLGTGYCWTDGTSGAREYKFIITPKKVAAPKYDGVKNMATGNKTTINADNVKDIRITTQYVGDTANGQTWTANVIFKEAYEQSISWYSPTNSQYVFNRGDWLNSTLTVTARNAGIYMLNFRCKPNYEWLDPDNVPQVTLTINRKPVDEDPYIIKNSKESNPTRGGSLYADAAGNATTTQGNIVQMTVDCDFNQHALYMFLGNKDAIDAKYNGNDVKISWNHGDPANQTYSVYNISETGDPTEWDDDLKAYKKERYSIATTKGQAIFVTKKAGTYTIELSPSSNYCWKEGGSESRTFIFKLNAQPVTPLDWQYKTEASSWTAFDSKYYEDGIFYTAGDYNNDDAALPYTGSEYTFAIGPAKALAPNGSYPTSGKYLTTWFGFYVVYENNVYFADETTGNIYFNAEHGPDDEPDIKTEVGSDGFLYISATQAGKYQVKVILLNIDYCWDGSTLTSDSGKEGDEGKSSITYQFTINKSKVKAPEMDTGKCVADSQTVNFDDPQKMVAQYYGKENVMAVAVTIAEKYKDVVKFDYIDKSDDFEQVEYNDAAGYKQYENGKLYFYFKATRVGKYEIKIYLDSTNHKWADDTATKPTDEYVVTLEVVTALVMNVNVAQGSNAIVSNVAGSDTVYPYELTFNENRQEITITRLGKGNVVAEGFKEQYDVVVKGYYRSGDEIGWDIGEDGYNYTYIPDNESLKLSVYHAGTYVITITPSYNYSWGKSGADDKSSVTIKLTVNPMQVGRPTIDPLHDGLGTVDNNAFVKTVPFSETAGTNSITILLETDTGSGMVNHPNAYKVSRWDGNTLANWTGSDPDEPVLNTTNGTITAQADSTGNHDLYIRLSDANNYTWNTDNDEIRYTLKITKKPVTSPDAWLVEGNTGTDIDAVREIDAFKGLGGSVSAGVSVTSMLAGKQYPQQRPYDGNKYYVYLTGASIKSIRHTEHNPNGNILLSVATKDASLNGQATGNISITPVVNGFNTLIAYEISVTNADTYYVTLEFATTDYNWEGTGINNDVSKREFVLKIDPMVVDVPKFEGLESQTLVDNSYTAAFAFDGTEKQINITGLEKIAGIVTIVRGDKIDGTTSVTLDGKLLMKTNSTPLYYATADYEDDYTITFSFSNPYNIIWAGQDEDADEAKVFKIKINSMEVVAPKIDSTGLVNEFTKQVQFTGFDVDTAKGILTLTNINALNAYLTPADQDLVNAEAFDNYLRNGFATPTSLVNSIAGGFTSWFQLSENITSATIAPYTTYWGVESGKLKVGTPIPAGDYTVTVKLLDSSNMVWKGKTDANGDPLRDDLTFTLKIAPMPIDIPIIEGTSADGVIGLTKRVTYTGNDQTIKLGNFWADHYVNNSDTSFLTNTANLWMTIDITDATPIVPDYDGAANDFGLKFVSYQPNHFAAGSSNTSSTGYITHAAAYDGLNKGLLTFSAKYAGTYIIRFELKNNERPTQNAVWNDPIYKDQDYIEVTFIIEKQEFETPVIDKDNATDGTISGNTITYTYALDTSYNAIERIMNILYYNLSTATNGTATNSDYMALSLIVVDGDTANPLYQIVSGTPVDNTSATSKIYNHAPGTNDDYAFKAKNAGTYEITFELTDFNNRCWKLGTEVQYVTFTFKINKQQLATPVQSTTFNLKSETVEGNNLTVDYDEKAHSMLIKFIIEAPDHTDPSANPATGNSYDWRDGTVISSHYLNYNLVVTDAKGDYRGTHYADASANTTNALFDFTGTKATGVTVPYTYNGDYAGDNFNAISTSGYDYEKESKNVYVLTAFATGEYKFTVALEDPDNMEWDNETTADITFTLTINKKVHDAPTIPTGQNSKQYTGEGLDYTIYNVYSVFNSEAEWNAYEAAGRPNPITTTTFGTQYEDFKVISADIKGTTYTRPADDATIDGLFEVVSWYEGNLKLRFTKVGTYHVEIKNVLPDEVEWLGAPAGTTDSIVLDIVVLPRDITAKFTFEVDLTQTAAEIALGTIEFDMTKAQEINVELKNGGTRWPLSLPVIATLTLSNLVTDPTIASPLVPEDAGLALEIYNDSVLVATLPVPPTWAGMPNQPVQASDGTWSVKYRFNMPYGQTNVSRGIYTLEVTQLDDPNGQYNGNDGSNYSILEDTQTQTYTLTPDPAPFDEKLIVWFYEESVFPGTWIKAYEGESSDNPLKLTYNTAGGYYSVQIGVTGYTNTTDNPAYLTPAIGLVDALADGKVMIDHVDGFAQGQNAGDYTYTVYLKSIDDDLWYFPMKGYTFYYKINPAKYDLSGLVWKYSDNGGTLTQLPPEHPFIYEPGVSYSVYVDNLPAGLAVSGYPVNATLGFKSNVQTNAGDYVTSVTFASQSTNYVTPQFEDTSTYDKQFDWRFEWTIEKQHIYVNWAAGSYNADGSVKTYNPVVDQHSEKFGYRFYVLANDADTGCTIQAGPAGLIYADATTGDEYALGNYIIRNVGGINKVFLEVDSITGGTGNVFYVEAYLTAAYEINYTFDFGEENNVADDFTENGNFKEFTIEDGTIIFNHITINKTVNISNQYEYTGDSQDAEVVIDLDTTGGAMDNGTVTVVGLYYRQTLDASGAVVINPTTLKPDYDEDSPLSYIPYDVGKYVFVAKLVINNSEIPYTLSNPVYYYEIVKQQLKLEDFEWRYTHVNADGEEITAVYDEISGVWKNTETKAPVTFVYDGNDHEISLVYTKNTNVVVIPFNGSTDVLPLNGTVYADATPGGASAMYTARFTLVYDEERFVLPTAPRDDTVNIPLVDDEGAPVLDDDSNQIILSYYVWYIEWRVEKQVLDLSLTDWEENIDYVFTVLGDGTYKKYSVELKNLPDYLKDRITYVTILKNDTNETAISNSLYNAGEYKTVATISTDLTENGNCLVDFDNYTIIGKPVTYGAGAKIEYTINWEIKKRLLEVPKRQAAYDWTNFDGNYHNLFNVLGIQTDWSVYYTIDVDWQTEDGSKTESPWWSSTGTAISSRMYSAYDAGIYTFEFSIDEDLNKNENDPLNPYSYANVAWDRPNAAAGTLYTTEDQKVELKVNKANVQVTGWNDNFESSTVKATGYGVKFVEYKFYTSTDGGLTYQDSSLDDVLASPGGEEFYISGVIPDDYKNSVSITYVPASEQYHKFTTRKLSDIPNKQAVGEKPYITGYTDSEGSYHSYTPAEIADIKTGAKIPTVIYTGGEFTFHISNWSYYETLVTLWNCDISELKQSEVGTYTLTLILKTDKEIYYYWKEEADGKIDRSSATLQFKIEYLKISIPDVDDVEGLEKEEDGSYVLTYDPTGSIQDILSKIYGDQLTAWLEQYGDYFEISGTRVAVDVGTYELYLKIKDEHSFAVRWADSSTEGSSDEGIAGTYKIVWTIKPYELKVPVLNIVDGKLSFVYNEKIFSIYDLFKIDDDTDVYTSIDLGLLKQYVTILGGSQAQNAGDYTVTFTLPSDNFAWSGTEGLDGTIVSFSGSTITIKWTIEKATIDFENAEWGYVDEDGNVHKYDKDASFKFKYTIRNGQSYIQRVQLVILTPDGADEKTKAEIAYLNQLLVNCTSYRTCNTTDNKYSAGNGAFDIGSYKTKFTFDKTRFDSNNYDIIAPNTDVELEWEIEARVFAKPDTTGWKFDGEIHDFMEVLGYGKDWANYFDIISVMYRGESDVSYAPYNGKDLAVVNFSLYKGYLAGSYKIEFKLKEIDGISWAGDVVVPSSGKLVVEFKCDKYELEILGWTYNVNDEGKYPDAPVVNVKHDTTLTEDEEKEFNALFEKLFYYYIYEDGDATMKEVQYADIQSGVAYVIELRIREQYVGGITIIGKYFFDFGDYNYDGQSLRWVPLPKILLSGEAISTAAQDIEFDYNGSKQVVEIYNPNGVYTIDGTIKNQLRQEGVILSADDTSFVYVMGGDDMLKQSAAGTYTVVVRLHSRVNLSWYDPAIYGVRKDSNDKDELYYLSDGQAVKDDSSVDLMEDVYDRSAQTLTFTIKLKGYEPIDMSTLPQVPDLEYNGTEQDITKTDSLKPWFDDLYTKYGDAIKIEGSKETDVPEGKTVDDTYVAGKYTVKISLSDATSSYWYLDLDSNGIAVFAGVKYVLHNDQFVLADDSGNPVFDDADGSVTEFNNGNYEYDSDNNRITFVDYEFTFDWTITAKEITAPELADVIYYTGSTIKVTDYDLTNYNSRDMKILSGGSAKAVGTYTATVQITSRNYIWVEEEAGEEGAEPTYKPTGKDTIEFTWEIKAAQVNLNGVIWKITGGGETYTFMWDTDEEEWVAQNGYPTYSRVNGQPVVYKVELEGLADVLKGHIQYTTNGTVKARAGSSAGKYSTTIELINTDNFETFELPDRFKQAFEWKIEQRVLDKPVDVGTIDFDDEVHDLLEMLNIDRSSDWKEYFTLDVWYTEDAWAEEVKYEGYGGDAYLVYGTGTYRIEVKLVDGINGKYSNVVWAS